ncbi:hypothetical protein [Lysobacter capsici]|uniref:hypothetical protein n=1 Tax=Lysobacter capsici TaxID=435897 RepID=UPI000AF1117E|nr:hypothetical protein [Lysobacter capsici]
MDTDNPQAAPEWTELVRKTGLDPLGMQNAGIRLYQRLLPGISNVTLRVRYYGLYAWLSRHYSQTNGSTDPKQWQRFIRRAEALYALIATERGGETGVSGSNWASRKLEGQTTGRIEFAEDARAGAPSAYLRQSWGAYGAAYASQLFVIDVYRRSTDHDVPILSPMGEELAEAFSRSGDGIAARFGTLVEGGETTIELLRELKRLSPSEIDEDGEESRCYQRLLFAQRETPSEDDLQRRRTLCLILDLGQRLGRTPWAEDVRWCLYARHFDGHQPWLINENLTGHRLRWTMYQANDLSQMAFAAILSFLLGRLLREPSGVPLQELVGEAVDEVLVAMEPAPQCWTDYVSSLALPASALTMDEPSERRLSDDLFSSSGAYTAGQCVDALRLLALVHHRLTPLRDEAQGEFGGLDPDGFRTVLSEWSFMQAHRGEDLRHFLCTLFEQRVLHRHLWVAMRKMQFQRDYTFLFEADEGRVRYRDDYTPVPTTPRLNSAVGFLQDLRLLGEQGLTPLGMRILDAVV